MKLLIRAFLFFYLLNAFNPVLAIKNPIKYGKVTQEELEMKTYAPDPTAPAVFFVLMDILTVMISVSLISSG